MRVGRTHKGSWKNHQNRPAAPPQVDNSLHSTRPRRHPRILRFARQPLHPPHQAGKPALLVVDMAPALIVVPVILTLIVVILILVLQFRRQQRPVANVHTTTPPGRKQAPSRPAIATNARPGPPLGGVLGPGHGAEAAEEGRRVGCVAQVRGLGALLEGEDCRHRGLCRLSRPEPL